jgi:glycosyltransferase involved in cell wall biosynthesis
MKRLIILADSNSIHTKKWVQILGEKFEVHLISFSQTKIEGIKNYNISSKKINPKGNNFFYLFKIFKIRSLLKKIKPDIINAHYLTSFGLVAALVKPVNTPLIQTVHGTDIMVTPDKNFILDFFAKFSLNKAHHIFSVAEHMTDKLKLKFGIDSSKITTIQYGVNFSQIREKTKSHKKIDFISTRNLIHNSNINIIIKAFEMFLDKCNMKSKLLIVGEGYQKNELMDYVKQKGLEANIIFKGELQHSELIEVLVQSKFFISLTNSDGTSLSLLEAMAAGAIPIVSKIQANTMWIEHEKNGYVSEISIEDLFQIMRKIKYDKNFVSINHKIITEKGDFDVNRIKIQNIFNQYVD